jgi:hypothetical protein
MSTRLTTENTEQDAVLSVSSVVIKLRYFLTDSMKARSLSSVVFSK